MARACARRPATALKERERDDRDDEIALAKSKVITATARPAQVEYLPDHFGLDGIDFEFSFDGVGPYLTVTAL